MGLKWAAAALLVAGMLHQPLRAQDGPRLETRAWPRALRCAPCVALQFGPLDMRLPLARIGKIVVLGSESSALHLLPKNNDARDGVLFLSIGRAEMVGRYQAAGLLPASESLENQAFFDRLGEPVAAGEPFSTMRRIEHLDRARRYLKASRGGLHAYWIEAGPGDSRVYFVVDGEEAVYALVGAVTPDVYRSVLANMRFGPPP